jgi:SAM-dependent methyltransferase
MMADDARALRVDESWDTYWRGTRDATAYSCGGSGHPVIRSFWSDLFQVTRRYCDVPRIIDIASGTGAVIDAATSAYGDRLPAFTCLDTSAAAMRVLRERYPSATTLVADARHIPLRSRTFDVVTSQFGVEYAGSGAITEARRLVAPGGRLGFLLHSRESSIYQECSASLDAVTRVRQSRFIPLARTLFTTGFSAYRGGDRAPYETAARSLAPALSSLESIMTDHGKHVAGDLVMRLYDDVATVHERLQHHVPSDILGWLDRLETELDAFAERMASMCSAAMNHGEFGRLCDALRDSGFAVDRARALADPGRPLPLAWALLATRN